MGSCFLIKDSFEGHGVHNFELNFHLHPDCKLDAHDGWWQINNRDSKIYLRLLEDNNLVPISGQVNPIHGWFAPCYGEKLKSCTLRCNKSGHPDQITFETVICTGTLIDMNTINEKLNTIGK